MRGPGCQDCVVTAVLGLTADPGPTLRIDADEQAALAALADSGLVPPLRLVHAVESLPQEESDVKFGSNPRGELRRSQNGH
nr:hypothetical protein [Kribbella sandramycini]